MSKHLQKRIEELEEEINALKEAIFYLAHCKQGKGYAFFDWLVRNRVYHEKRVRFDFVVRVLMHRLQDIPVTKKKPVKGVSSALLYKKGQPTYEEAKQLIKEALEMPPDDVVVDLFHALKRQGMMKVLADLQGSPSPRKAKRRELS